MILIINLPIELSLLIGSVIGVLLLKYLTDKNKK